MSALDENQAKANVTGEIGEQLAKAHTKAEEEVQQLIGARAALREFAALSAKNIHEHVDKDLAEGKLPTTELEIASYVKKRITQMAEAAFNLSEKQEKDRFVAEGKAAALRVTLDVVQKYHNAACTRVLQIKQAQAEAALALVKGDKPQNEQEAVERRKARAPGEHPGASPLDARRLAVVEPEGSIEGLQEAVEELQEVVDTPEPVEGPSEPPEPPPEPAEAPAPDQPDEDSQQEAAVHQLKPGVRRRRRGNAG